jgi:hypothetical protein
MIFYKKWEKWTYLCSFLHTYMFAEDLKTKKVMKWTQKLLYFDLINLMPWFWSKLDIGTFHVTMLHPYQLFFTSELGVKHIQVKKIIRHLKISDPFFYYRLLFWNRRAPSIEGPPKNFDCFATLEGPGPFIAGRGVWAFAVLQCLSKFFIFLSIVKRFDYNFDFIQIISVYNRIFFTESTFLSEGKKKL